MVIEAHDYFCVTVVKGYGVYFDKDFVRSWNGEGRSGEGKVGDASLGGDPLFGFGGERHCCCCEKDEKRRGEREENENRGSIGKEIRERKKRK